MEAALLSPGRSIEHIPQKFNATHIQGNLRVRLPKNAKHTDTHSTPSYQEVCPQIWAVLPSARRVNAPIWDEPHLRFRSAMPSPIWSAYSTYTRRKFVLCRTSYPLFSIDPTNISHTSECGAAEWDLINGCLTSNHNISIYRTNSPSAPPPK